MENDAKINSETVNYQTPEHQAVEIGSGDLGKEKEIPIVSKEQKIEEKIKKFADEFFRGFLSGSAAAGYFRAREVQEKLNKIISEANDGEEREEGAYDAKFKEATKIFLEEMMSFC